MKQRAAIARTLAIDPGILLMDEPFGALDAQTRSLMQAELLRIWQRSRKTVVFVTHDVQEAVFLAERDRGDVGRPGRIKEIVEAKFDREDPEPDARPRVHRHGRPCLEPGARRGDPRPKERRRMTAVAHALYAAPALAVAWEAVTRPGIVPASALPSLDQIGDAWYELAARRRSLDQRRLVDLPRRPGLGLAIVVGGLIGVLMAGTSRSDVS